MRSKMLCIDYSNLQERRNITKLYLIARGYWFPVYGLGNECAERYFLQEEDATNKISFGWNKVSEYHTKPTNAFSQYTPTICSAVVACRLELERLYIYSICIQICL